MAAQSQEVALPGSAAGLSPPAASETLPSLLAWVGNKSLLSRAGVLITWEWWDRPRCSVGAEEVAGTGRASPGIWEVSGGSQGLWHCDHHESPVGLTQHPLAGLKLFCPVGLPGYTSLPSLLPANSPKDKQHRRQVWDCTFFPQKGV